jgi:RND superfamily putative drug exporter
MKLDATVHVGGITAEMADVRATTQADFLRVAALCLAVIFLIVLALLKDPFLSAFMVAATLLSYLATLGISGWVFTGLMGEAGLDWKVEIFLFVVLIVVGQDYNIFLASRLAQEALSLPLLRATRQAVVHTGPVISSCGIIMAATLGSLMAGDLQMLRQLGFALSLGMIIDTFIVRPLLLPAFVALTGRAGGRRLAK